MIGAGVLTLPWVMAQLGWILGISYIIIVAIVTLYTSNLLTDCYRTPDPVTGKRNRNYMEAVKTILGNKISYNIFLVTHFHITCFLSHNLSGGKMHLMCGIVQYANLSGAAIGYTITTSVSIV